ncbi:S-layer protein [uncultured Eubacteriales bacterium]|uniref:S-layer protein n=1 Tax=uncultured Eubacteriales bacterium TaxID=172733 RepID=A0A212JRM5_9FIRM|nr:S-layer protein [uncultured Eubacteriales bacterium]
MKKSLWKRATTLVLAGALALTGLSGCGSTAPSGSAVPSGSSSAAPQESSAAPAKQYVIGIAEAQANDEVTTRRAYLEDFIAPTYNVKFIFSEVLKDDAATKAFIENCADSGADAIIDFKSMSGQMAQICADNDMVYTISGNYVAHPEFLENDYPNFAGAVGSNNAELGALFAGWLRASGSADGSEGFLIATGIASSGNQQHIEITQAILNGLAEQYGLTYEESVDALAVVSETTNVANNKGLTITLYPGSPNKETWLPGISSLIQSGNYGVFLSAGQTYNQSATVVNEVEQSFGMDIKVASLATWGDTLDTAFNTKDPNGNPSIDLANVKSTSVLTAALFAITYNALNGDVDTACRNAEGKPLYFEFIMMGITTSEQLATMDGWDDKASGKWVAGKEMVDAMLTTVHPDLTAEEINTYLGTLDYETIKGLMG